MSVNNLLVDILSILPEEIECLIQAPSLENEIVESLMEKSEFDYYRRIKVNAGNKPIFINQALLNSVGNYFQSIQIKKDNKLLFEGFDGLEFGVLSKHVVVPDWFKQRYIPDEICIISNEW